MKTKIQFTNENTKELYNGKLEYATEGSAGFDLRACRFDIEDKDTEEYFYYEENKKKVITIENAGLFLETAKKINIDILYTECISWIGEKHFCYRYDFKDNLKKIQNAKSTEEINWWVNEYKELIHYTYYLCGGNYFGKSKMLYLPARESEKYREMESFPCGVKLSNALATSDEKCEKSSTSSTRKEFINLVDTFILGDGYAFVRKEDGYKEIKYCSIQTFKEYLTKNFEPLDKYHNKYFSIKKALHLNPQASIKIGTGVKIQPPQGCGTFVYPRSGFSTKNEVILLNGVGVIDSDCTGEIIVCLKNISNKPVEIALGDKMAQAVIQPVLQAHFEYVEELELTKRGEGGFGSTGK